MTDYYDRAVEYFCERPDEIKAAWMTPTQCAFGQLFGFLNPERDAIGEGGCPAMVRRGFTSHPSVPQELVNEIRLDERIDMAWPRTDLSSDALRSNLCAFAEWQRRIDKELGRKEPVEVTP